MEQAQAQVHFKDGTFWDAAANEVDDDHVVNISIEPTEAQKVPTLRMTMR